MRGGTLVFDTAELRSLPGKTVEKKRLVPGDLLVNKSSGSAHLVGLSVIFQTPPDDRSYLCSNFVHCLRPNQAEVEPEFLSLALLSPQFRGQVFNAQNTTSGLRNLNLTEYLAAKVGYPCRPEQRRVVGRIKECLSRVEEMQRLRAETEVEARSLVSAAVRELFDPMVRDGTTKPFGELVATTRLGLVRSKSEQGDNRAFAYFKMNNIARGGRVELSPMTRVDASPSEVRENALAEGDFLFNTRNSLELVGKTAIAPAYPEPLLFNNNILRVRFRDDVLPRYVNYAFQHPFVQRELDLRKSKTTNVCAVYYKSLQTLPIPLPKRRADQEDLTALVQRVETAAITMESQLREQGSDYPALRESILREAFAGNL